MRLTTLALLVASASSVAWSQTREAPSCGEKSGVRLIVFVGSRIDIRPVGTAQPPLQPFLLDQKFVATYKVLQVLCGSSSSPQIEFDVYDHYGTPAFAAFDTVLLYVSEQGGHLVHEKYLYDPVYRTEDGSWAGCGDPYAGISWAPSEEVHAVPVRFKHEVTFSVASMTEEQIRERYPPQFFTRRGERVVCTAGAGIADLFRAKRSSVLTARGLF